MIYLFDVDGTLTPPRDIIDVNFEHYFYKWMQQHDTMLISGATKEHTLRQLRYPIWNEAKTCFQCSGHEIWVHNTMLYRSPILKSDGLVDILKKLFSYFNYPCQTGKHIDMRQGMVNFSLLGQNYSRKQRADYIEWEKQHNALPYIKAYIELHSKYEVFIDGQTSVDIFEQGRSKEQVILNLLSNDAVTFFGDKITSGGNDATVAQHLPPSFVHAVDNYFDTWKILEKIDG